MEEEGVFLIRGGFCLWGRGCVCILKMEDGEGEEVISLFCVFCFLYFF